MALSFDGSEPDGSPSLVQRAVDAVNAHILERQLKVGDTLPGEGHFAGTLGVSRAVMREAFGALAALRLIDVGNGRRPRVGAIDGSVMGASMSHAVSTQQVTVSEVWDVRRTLELRTAALAAVNRSDEEAVFIASRVDLMEQALGDLSLMVRHDIAFHQAIARASGNALFHQIVRSFAPMMEIAVPAAWRTRTAPGELETVIDRHRAIATAISDRDEIAASAAMEAHFDGSIGMILRRSDAL
jgi:GntR family transcriptional regulator, transcriptional repressor for pyruvate dehydrogenase complex